MRSHVVRDLRARAAVSGCPAASLVNVEPLPGQGHEPVHQGVDAASFPEEGPRWLVVGTGEGFTQAGATDVPSA